MVLNTISYQNYHSIYDFLCFFLFLFSLIFFLSFSYFFFLYFSYFSPSQSLSASSRTPLRPLSFPQRLYSVNKVSHIDLKSLINKLYIILETTKCSFSVYIEWFAWKTQVFSFFFWEKLLVRRIIHFFKNLRLVMTSFTFSFFFCQAGRKRIMVGDVGRDGQEQ